MFGYFRVFALISLVVVAGFTVVSGTMFRNVAINNVNNLIEVNNRSIADGYIESVWKGYSKSILAFTSNSAEKNNPDIIKSIQDFGLETINYFKKMPLLRVNIYSSTGTLLIKSDMDNNRIITTSTSSPDINFLQNKFKSGEIVSQIINDSPLNDGESATILQTLVPITVGTTNDKTLKTDGVIEIIADITPSQRNLINAQTIGSIYVMGFFLLYLGFLFFMAKRAENIIAKQHEANVELAAAAAIAQSENRDKSQFLANISHELRTPLNAIIGFSEIIKSHSAKDMDEEKLNGYINDIHSSGVHLLSLINDILDYSKAEAGKLEMEVAEVNLNKLVHNCVRLVTPRAEAAQVTLVEALPKETLNIITDSKKFKQILLNLLSNAVKFTPAGGEVKITAWANVSNDTYMFEVRDTGIGIAPKDISRAMAPFGQVDNTLSRKYEGTGLGLPLTKKFVELMGGKFEIESEVGEGTTIRFSVPKETKESNNLIVKKAI